jgi:hypothetical protein
VEVGGYPERLGDPDGMEALAAELLRRADSITGAAESLSNQADGATFEGPAARRLRDATKERRATAGRMAEALEETALLLKRSALDCREQLERGFPGAGLGGMDP